MSKPALSNLRGKKFTTIPLLFPDFSVVKKVWVGPKLALLQEDQLSLSFKSDPRFNFPPLTTMAIGMDLFHLEPAQPTDISFIAFLALRTEKGQKAITKLLENKKKYKGAQLSCILKFDCSP